MIFGIKIFDADAQRLTELVNVLGDLKSVSFQHVDKMLYLKPPRGIDILYLPLTAAERFGSVPLIHKSQILPTSASKNKDWLPDYIVTGTCLAKDDPRGPIPEMRILLSAVFDAIRTFNEESQGKLRQIGFWGYDLLPGITPAHLRGILVEIVPELLAATSDS